MRLQLGHTSMFTEIWLLLANPIDNVYMGLTPIISLASAGQEPLNYLSLHLATNRHSQHFHLKAAAKKQKQF